MNSGRSGEIGLFFKNMVLAEVVVTQFRGNMRLIMVREVRTPSADVRPFGKAFSPPGVVLRNSMKLWKVKCDGLDVRQTLMSRQRRFAWNFKIRPIRLK